MISIKNIHKYFNKGKQNEIHVINDISLELPDNGMIALFGKSGCGKTTLLNTLGGLSDVSCGTIEIDGQDLFKNRDLLRNKYIGYVFQNYMLDVNKTVYENVADALKLVGIRDEKEIDVRVKKALTIVGLEKFDRRTPETLSGGQQQRVAIARAIVKNPAVILADEPTGNLDENNTIMIMDLLKLISKDHLVVLVTHEENLVDSYCDKVIELKDGSIVSSRDNVDANGYSAKNRNHIYLKDLSEKDYDADFGKVKYYGDNPDSPLDIKIVNHNGMIYLKVNKEKVQLLDDSTEIKLIDEKYVEKIKNDNQKRFDIEPLEHVDEKKIGKLFTFKESVISGWKEIYRHKEESKKGAKRLRNVMTVFSVIFVLLTAFYGMTIKRMSDAKTSNNPNTFYVYFNEMSKGEILNDITENEESGIKSVCFKYGSYQAGDSQYAFSMPEFESSMETFYDNKRTVVSFHSADSNIDVANDMKIVAGTKKIKDNEIVITTAVADQIIKNCTYDFINEYDNLIGFTCVSSDHADWDDSYTNLHILGIVESDENIIFYSKKYLAENRYQSLFAGRIKNAKDLGMDVADGSVIARTSNAKNTTHLLAGDSIMLNGKKLIISKVQSEDTDLQNDEMTGESLYDDSEEYEKYGDYSDDNITYILSENDYYECANLYGECIGPGITQYDGNYTLAVLYALDTDKAYKYLSSKYDKKEVDYLNKELTTPDDLHKKAKEDIGEVSASTFIIYGILLFVMCLCIYMIMRGNVMKKNKSIGVYRCIGATKKNIIFKFACEILVLVATTSFAGYFVTSAAIWLAGNSSYSFLIDNVFYYPVWMGLIVLIALFVISFIVGLIPVMTALAKSPSEIIAKYDI